MRVKLRLLNEPEEIFECNTCKAEDWLNEPEGHRPGLIDAEKINL